MRDAQNNYIADQLNQNQLNQLVQLLQLVKNAGHEIVPLGRLNSDSPNITLTGPLTSGSSTGGLPVTNLVAFRLSPLQDYYEWYVKSSMSLTIEVGQMLLLWMSSNLKTLL